ncbi:hypothetical protein [Alloyangia pacifica]|uniref:Uncharacterized protein n=1 Tax=Alloyangia pacifica TaxID=311180 RepID=A0A1I6VM70_9RHOB|nr:hypothetical protein [Alloyangia pacifica]SDI05667.1 hypothetical protein SAMN04488245_11213 [Alloyangia pacifica]SFT14832.1 hypothetical protein SAMN04488050_11213 [Alloyangia pacifica]
MRVIIFLKRLFGLLKFSRRLPDLDLFVGGIAKVAALAQAKLKKVPEFEVLRSRASMDQQR